MPKKKTAYWFFFQDFKEEQRLKGITYTEKQELDKDADKAWRVRRYSYYFYFKITMYRATLMYLFLSRFLLDIPNN